MVGVAIILLLPGSVDAVTFTVDDSGGANFLRIQNAINAANSGDTIIVYSGTYYETVVVNKQLELLGQEKDRGGMPVVNARGAGNAITIIASGVILDGFDAKTSVSYNGIKIDSYNNVIRNNNASINKNGIYLSSISGNNTLSGNIANSNKISGFYFDSSNNNNLTNNTVNSNIYGIVFISSNNTTLTNNTANSNIYGIVFISSERNILISNNASSNSYGINMISSINNILTKNTANSNSEYGINFDSSRYNNLTYNTVRSNGKGIRLNSSINITLISNNARLNKVGINIISSGNNILINNIMESNTNYGIIFDSSSYNNITNNSMRSNGIGMQLNSSNENTIIKNIASMNKYGINIISSINNSLAENIIDSNNYFGINLVFSNYNNLIRNTANSNMYGIYLVSSNNITIISNNVILNTIGINIISSGNNILMYNIADSNTNYGINFNSSSYNNITNNSMRSNGIGMQLNSSNKNTIIKNIVSMNKYGINIISSINNSLTENIIDSNNNIGINLAFSNYNNLILNTAHSNMFGIYLVYSNNITIISNNVILNTIGINIISSDNNTLMYNIVDSNNNYGINFDSSSNNNLTNNSMRSNGYGIQLNSSNKNTIIKNNVIMNNYGINIISSKNNSLTENIIDSNNNYGINLAFSSYNNLSKNIAYSNNNRIYLKSSSNNSIYGNIATGFALVNSSNSNLLSNNIISASDESIAGIYIDSSGLNYIKGGSIKSNKSYDYYLKDAGTTNEFISTDFTGLRKIFFKDQNSYFNYNNDIKDKIWLRTNISTTNYLTRKILSWNNTLIQWNDTGNLIANYTIMGLLNNSIYDVYNKSQGIKTNSYTLKTDSNGNLPSFMIVLNGDSEIKTLYTNNSLELSGIKIVNITLNTTEIYWKTNEPSDSLIKYGRSSLNYNLQKYDSSSVTNHSITLSNLSLATKYFFVLNSTNQVGNSRESQELSVQTISPFSNHSIAMVYQRVSDKMQNDIGRNISNITDMFNSTKTDIIFRGWWDENYMFENCTQQILTPKQQESCEKLSISYTHLKNATTIIKKVSPNITFIGAVPAQQIYRTTYNPLTYQLIEFPETWNMSLDPAKFGIMNISKVQFQCDYAKNRTWLNETFNCTQYDPANVTAYFPDITNDNFHQFLLSLAKRQIDSGADAIWFDSLFSQANYIESITNDENYSGVNDSYFASSNIIDEIHKYKQGVYAGTWVLPSFPYPSPNFDFVTMSPSRDEILNQKFNEQYWNNSIKRVKDIRGEIPIIAFIDWSDTSDTPLGAFSQNLSKENQSNFLNVADTFFQKKGIIFAYPLHGGYLGNDAKIISYGNYTDYDALAPEFDTFEMIKQLSLKKVGS